MKIGLYGGMANNTYVLAGSLARAGANVVFLRDQSDRYAFSQPVWEDAACTLSFEDTKASAAWTPDRWRRFEERHHWAPPAWLVDRHSSPAARSAVGGPRPKAGPFERLTRWFLLERNRPYWQSLCDEMHGCDFLLVCGIEGALLAAQSGRPYGIWPHGGDIRLAAGLQSPPRGLKSRLRQGLVQRLVRKAFEQAAWIGSHDPTLVGGHIGDVASRLNVRVVHLPLPLQCRPRLERTERRHRLAELCERLGTAIPTAETMVLIPSRIDFSWKGHDLLLAALERLPASSMQFIFSGWGADHDKAVRALRGSPWESRATFLPCTLSKPLLYEMYAAVDLVIDQFRLGTYGTAAVEAMSRGTPVMMHIDEQVFRARGWTPPPVLGAANVAEIAAGLSRVSSGRVDLDEHERDQSAWIRGVHGSERVVTDLLTTIASGWKEAGSLAA